MARNSATLRFDWTEDALFENQQTSSGCGPAPWLARHGAVHLPESVGLQSDSDFNANDLGHILIDRELRPHPFPGENCLGELLGATCRNRKQSGFLPRELFEVSLSYYFRSSNVPVYRLKNAIF